MQLLFASTNPHKEREIAELLAPFGVEIVGLGAAGSGASPEEDGETLGDNARIKASHYARLLGRPCLADDSGLEVEALGGAPGVRSARYAGEAGSREERDQKNRERLLAELQRLIEPSRRAALVCTLCLVDSRGRVLFETRGECHAEIIDTPRGGKGFGYDSLLWLPDLSKTAAELDPEQWHPRSHRGRAARALGDWLLTHRAVLSPDGAQNVE